MSPRIDGKTLLVLARDAISVALGASAKGSPPQDDWLKEPGATFVTLTQHGQLRGCIGSLEARQSLIDDVRSNAVHAALHDSRFMPLETDELGRTTVEVSLLTPPEPIAFRDEEDALAQLRPGIDGVIFEFGLHRSTFLPQVWEQLPEPREFMAHLKRKAGLPGNFWAEGIRLSRYTVQKWKESAPGRP